MNIKCYPYLQIAHRFRHLSSLTSQMVRSLVVRYQSPRPRILPPLHVSGRASSASSEWAEEPSSVMKLKPCESEDQIGH